MKLIIKGISSLALISLLFFGCNEQQKPAESQIINHNTLTQIEIDDGWILLFDGKTTDGWRGYQKETFPDAWKIEDGSIKIQSNGNRTDENQQGGDIIFDRLFSNFHLKIEWKVSKGGNSGIFYRASEDSTFDFIWKSASEMQVLDNTNHPDAALGKDGNRQAGSLYDLFPANPQNSYPHNEWNSAEIIAQGTNIQHIQNGEVVVEYTIGSDEMNERIAVSKWPNISENWGDLALEGIIGLQDHGDNVWFRNIKIKEL
jgi:hypothetical protein